MSFLNVSGISVVEEGNTILKNISFTQQEYQNIAIAGETGSGKSTLLQTIAGLVQAASGQVLFEGKKVRGPQDVLVPGHAGIAYLSQQYELPQFLRVEQVLKYANTLTAGEADKLYKICQISHLLKRRTNQLSGGEKQRIALARLLTSSPRLLLLDEPFSNLDMVHKNTLKAVIHAIGESLEITSILISHDPADTLSWADEILVLKNGKLQQKGTPTQVYRQPKNEYVAGLFGKYNVITPALAQAIPGCPETGFNKKKALIRPEHFILTSSKKGLPGEVKKVTFYGSHYETEVILAGAVITIKTLENAVQRGEQVFVAMQNDRVWAM